MLTDTADTTLGPGRQPVVPCGPMRPSTVMRKTSENMMEKPIVRNMKTPNLTKKMMMEGMRKSDEPMVVIQPDNTEMPTSSSDACTRPSRSGRTLRP